MATSTDICNIALDMLSQKKIMSIDGTDSISQSCKINYEQSRDELLEGYYWGFAKKKASLAADVVAPSFGWLYSYEIPSDCLTTSAVNLDGNFNGVPVDYEIVGNKIHTNLEAPLLLTYTVRLTTPNKYSALFVRALAAKIAASMAYRLTGNTQSYQIMANAYTVAINDAMEHDSLQGASENPFPHSDSALTSRYV